MGVEVNWILWGWDGGGLNNPTCSSFLCSFWGDALKAIEQLTLGIPVVWGLGVLDKNKSSFLCPFWGGETPAW